MKIIKWVFPFSALLLLLLLPTSSTRLHTCRKNESTRQQEPLKCRLSIEKKKRGTVSLNVLLSVRRPRICGLMLEVSKGDDLYQVAQWKCRFHPLGRERASEQRYHEYEIGSTSYHTRPSYPLGDLKSAVCRQGDELHQVPSWHRHHHSLGRENGVVIVS